MTYRTHQRDAVHNLLKEKDCHLTAEEIASELKRVGTPVGLTTVYRALSALVEEGCVRKFVADSQSCYQYVSHDGECHSHLHFKCAKCGKLYHVDCELLEELSHHIREEHDFLLDSSKTVFYGVCADCHRKES